MTILSQVGLAAPTGLTTDHPIVAWSDYPTASVSNVFVAPQQVIASFADPNFPAGNTSNPATYLKWKSNSGATQLLHFTFSPAASIDYVAIVGHNFFSASIPVGIGKDAGNTQVFAPAIPPDDGILLWRFNPISTTDIWINMPIGSPVATTFPEIAVVYMGRLLYVQRRMYAGHTPITQGRSWKATNGMSESGQYLGRIVLQEFRKSKIPLSLLDPTWYRANFDPFLRGARVAPFFFAWRPATYPDEIGYMWLTSEPAPAPTAPSNLISVNLDVTGIA